MTDDHTDRLDRLESLVEYQQETIEQQRDRIEQLESAQKKTVADGGDVKVVGEIEGDETTGVHGKVTGDDGYGVKGEVDGEGGYGLYTPDDAKVEGTAEMSTVNSADSFTITTGGPERALELGVSEEVEVEEQDGDEVDMLQVGANVVFGYPGNEVRDDAIGAVISGGGQESSEDIEFYEDRENVVYADYGTVGGGVGNRAGEEADEDDFGPSFSTVGGGQRNEASGHMSTIGGGNHNTAASPQSTIGGGSDNEALGERFATVGGGWSNVADGEGATVAGGGATFDGLDEGNAAYGTRSTVGGGGANVAGDEGNGVTHATVAGGSHNRALGDYATVSGGGPENPDDPLESNNVAYDAYCTIGGGAGNEAGTEGAFQMDGATVSGGRANRASAALSTVGGGDNNTASEWSSTVGGGENNTASGSTATVPGGKNNEARGSSSFAAGAGAYAESDRTFVWNDESEYHAHLDSEEEEGFSSDEAVDGEPVTGTNTFNVSASGGVRFVTGETEVTYIEEGSAGWSNTSTRAAKTNIDPVDPQEALEGVDSLDIATWEYKDESGNGKGTTHVGPMAEEFHDAFDVGNSDKHINSINIDGVALAAIQGLSRNLDEKDDRIEELDTENERLHEENKTLRERVEAIEAKLGIDTADAASADD